ncbi:glutathione S-transferase [Pacificimonas flava]|uniref:Glutathione S-transferase n=2 Tax=Pacificimonas TaxID=1960290 RepID=A0A219B189_9SPHN|nr:MULTISPECIES: glutathione S-transferase [Pacificimonas]MBZ6378257.1 glutathione S-transferase [Pacificimonas aurantium]OWV32122.1 glutathione S-transferase [Pacificimonas flava]
MRIILGNKRYSSWSLRGWLAMKQSGQDFEELVIPMDTPEWAEKKADPALMPSSRVPTVWDGDIAVWESLAIIDWLSDRYGQTAYWPVDGAARAFARSIAAEMHAGFTALRRQCPMDVCSSYRTFRLEEDARRDAERIEQLWTKAREDYGDGGPYLFGAFGAADMMYAPVAMRFRTYGIDLTGAAATYQTAICAHPWITEWCDAAAEEPESWTIEHYEDHVRAYL